MREFRRKKEVERPRLKLVRGLDGRLKSADDGSIADIWAEQKRIRLAEAIEEDKRRTEKKAQRQAAVRRLKERFKLGGSSSASKGSVAAANPKELVVNIALPRLSLPKLGMGNFVRLGRKRFLAFGAITTLVVFAAVGFSFFADSQNKADKQASGGGVLNAGDLKREIPQFRTILPEGKSIEDLGGWALVSPPDKDPVFAYVDSVNGTQLNVSQQLLPEAFKDDMTGELAKLAQSFGANQQLVVDGVNAYLGTSAKGPQSLIFASHDLLILIRSSSSLTNDQWVAYVASLR